jgi:hypothetical protein
MAAIVTHADAIQLGNVRVGVDGAAEMDEHRRLVDIPRADIVRVDGVYTVGGERPAVTLIIGLALVAFAIVPIATLIDVFRRGGTYYIEWAAAAVGALLIAAWLIHLSVRRRWVLLVTTRRDRRKLLFPKDVTQVDVEAFVAQAKAQFGMGGAG